MLPIDVIEIPEISEEVKEHLNEKGKSEVGSTRLSNPPKIMILKREKKQRTESSSAPMTIFPERVDKPNLAESPKGKPILPEKVNTSKASPRNWMNMVDPWTSQWVKKVVDQDDLIRSLKHVRSFICT